MTHIITIDLGFQGFPAIIAAFAAPTGDGRFVLFESGPASTTDQLERSLDGLGFALGDLAAVFATHVHLDHSGAAGGLARRTGCAVYAHPAGAAHLIDPHAKLLPSAERIYGEMLVPLWGEIEGVPSRQLKVVASGETVVIGGLEVAAWHTPGHAAHHIAWQVGGDVVTGDVGGIRFPGADHVLPPMPPPDIDVELWRQSLDLIRGLEPERLLLTHFGAFSDPARHLDELEGRLIRWTAIAEKTLAAGGDPEALGSALLELDDDEIARSGASPENVERYRRLCPIVESSTGLYRYVSKRQQ
ncbi:MAG: MBL fold metallo-hydrolase [Thermoanaerobaculales bacterium]|jgi:glyoxylase-like metal-dependent hydrolase (beta-lactamase superfamily II)|nr:MBL fold metallo-hydrolase [Thermoanaerobaculales bacterium]